MVIEITCTECEEKIGEKVGKGEGIEEEKTHGVCRKCENASNERIRLMERVRSLVKRQPGKPATQK